MIQAIIFDCFGVLATEGWLPFKQEHFGHDKQRMQRASELSQQANDGIISYDNFVRQVATMASVGEDVVQQALRRNTPNTPLFDYIKKLKPQYKIGFLSNSASDRLESIFTEQQIALFDAVVMSFQEGTSKPDSRIYEEIARKLGVKPNECVFIDDQEWYAQAAGAVGMHGVWYQSIEQVITDLDNILAK